MSEISRREAMGKVAAGVVAAVTAAAATASDTGSLGNGACTKCRCRGFQPMGDASYCYCGHSYNSHRRIHTRR
jgi:hypothetical protein